MENQFYNIMDFLKLDSLWTYQLPEWDNYEKEDVEEELNGMNTLSIVEYTMGPNSDVWTVRYKDCDFILVLDLVHGCEIRAFDRDDLTQLEKLIKSLNL